MGPHRRPSQGAGRHRRPARAEPERGWIDPRPRATRRSMPTSSAVLAGMIGISTYAGRWPSPPGLRRAVVALQVAGADPDRLNPDQPLSRGRARAAGSVRDGSQGPVAHDPPAWWGTWHLRKDHKQAGMIPLECGLADGAAVA
jgi:hypothetical protein